jgi:ABC-type amino acid transport substrate-binding protein
MSRTLRTRKGGPRILWAIALSISAGALVGAACGSDDSPGGTRPEAATAASDGAEDKLARVLARGTLLLATDPAYRVDDPVNVGYDVERNGLDDVASGKLDAFLCQETAGDQAISEGLHLRSVDPPAYVAYIGGALDRTPTTPARRFFDRVNGIVERLHADGTLARLSRRYFRADYASAAARFDLSAIGQTVR